MPTFLPWNVQGKPLDALVLGLVDRFAVDVVLLIEHNLAMTRLPEWLDRVGFREHIGTSGSRSSPGMKSAFLVCLSRISTPGSTAGR